jgi:hypothetical protein
MKIEIHEVARAVSKLKNGKAAGEHGITNERVKSGELAIVERLVRPVNFCTNLYMGSVALDWRCAIVTLFNSKGISYKKNARTSEV